MTPSTWAVADAPVCWAPAIVPNNQASQRSNRHAWPSVDGLAVALARLWALLHRQLCSCRCATPRVRMFRELPRPSRSPDRNDKTFDACISPSSFKLLPAGRPNRSTGQKLDGKPLRRRRLWTLVVYINLHERSFLSKHFRKKRGTSNRWLRFGPFLTRYIRTQNDKRLCCCYCCCVPLGTIPTYNTYISVTQ